MESKKLYFDVDATQIDIKSILKKEFLELRMKAISTANPNRNNSWFTKESLLASKDSFKNKPILGYWENGDFVSHNGEWKEDPETNIDYWDTTDVRKGERPIGFIRESDEVDVVDDPETGLSWIVLSCALWTQYNYKQVKRLLQDAKKAKQNGGPTKNISVEVDITDYEDLPNGVMKINAFNLVGITILGSRNGVKVEPGIAGAELSVVDIMGTALYEKQMQSLRLAYEKLDGSENSKKEEVSEMGLENEQSVVEEQNTDSTQANFEDTNQNSEANTEPVSESISVEDGAGATTVEQNTGSATEGEDHQQFENQENGESNQETVHQNNENQEEIRDINWLLDRISGFGGELECCLNYYVGCADCIDGSDYIIPVLKRVYGQTVDNEKELIGLMAKIAEGLKPEEKELAIALSENYDCKAQYEKCVELEAKCEELTKECEELTASKEALEGKFAEIEKAEAHKNFMAEAKVIINNAKLTDEIALSFEKECEEGNIASVEDLKKSIGLKLYELAAATPVEKPAEEPKGQEPAASFEAPVNTPSTNNFVKEENKGKKKDKWEELKEYNRN